MIPATIPTNATSLALPADIPFDAWLEVGRSLFAQRSTIDWMAADWIATGVDRFKDQIELNLLGGGLGVDPKYLTQAAKTARAFPEALRDPSLTIQHHGHVADLPADERLAMLKRAHVEHWSARKTRVEAMKHKVETGQITMLADDDFAQHAMMKLSRAWNRAPASVRADFLEMVQEANGGVIDA